jgi:1-acyl-sn-glycerol-3-phosphate acyltransferase
VERSDSTQTTASVEEEVDLLARAFETGDRPSSLRFYRVVRRVVRSVLFPYFDVVAVNEHHLDLPGPMILAPVHRSHLDSPLLASLSSRRIRALGKQSLFEPPVVRWVCAALGAIPVRRGEADREALKAARALLDRGESMIVFPEGGRQQGHEVAELFGGASWLASKTGARVIPIGISGTGEALREGSRRLRRVPVGIVVGEPMDPPQGVDGKRPGRQQLREFTARLAAELQAVQDEARGLVAGSA